MQISKDYLTQSLYTRPVVKREDTLAIVLHWVAGASKQTAKGIRNYFESLKDGPKYVSAQYTIGYDGQIIQMMDMEERAYHVGHGGNIDPVSGKYYTDFARDMFGKYALYSNYSPSYCCIGIEMCHEFPDGRFSKATLESASDLCVELFKQYPNLTPEKNLTTHERVVGWKWCPLWFHSHPEDFEDFKRGVSIKLGG